jgi:hypothetical protein
VASELWHIRLPLNTFSQTFGNVARHCWHWWNFWNSWSIKRRLSSKCLRVTNPKFLDSLQLSVILWAVVSFNSFWGSAEYRKIYNRLKTSPEIKHVRQFFQFLSSGQQTFRYNRLLEFELTVSNKLEASFRLCIHSNQICCTAQSKYDYTGIFSQSSY